MDFGLFRQCQLVSGPSYLDKDSERTIVFRDKLRYWPLTHCVLPVWFKLQIHQVIHLEFPLSPSIVSCMLHALLSSS